MSQLLDLPVAPTPLLGAPPRIAGAPGPAVVVPEQRGPVDDVVLVFEDNAPVAGGSYHLAAVGPALAHAADGERIAELTGVWALPGRRRRDRVRRALAALERSASLAGYARLRVAVDASRTDVLAVLRAGWFTPVEREGRPQADVVVLEKWLLPA
ncbi:hypothetical protein [Cellulomonas gilvus]|uniref:GCN5-related N-acetyltransferase n=1 Tax=Cellulomonas gilvus (strain ATCC 13127 / NRRL B-14078) TaxID=593907 RepID=F8A0R3_CELGA|nr:hypothetical protein [Cellulomonas gilvus]AEI11535.1 hypothetical protein Celgi_1016 [Cellulomonas gilvus ATCC 13127]